MIKLGLNDETFTDDDPRVTYGALEPSDTPSAFDWVFGVVLPVACFFFDPIVFKSDNGGGLLGAVKPFAYLLSYVSVMAMMAWLLFGERLKWFNAVLAGLFAAGGIVSLMVGIFLFPFSILGLLILIGALGFTPFFTAWIFLRNARRAFSVAKPYLKRKVLIPVALLAALYAIVVPAVINSAIVRSMDNIRFGDKTRIETEAAKLTYVRFMLDPEPLSRGYSYIPKEERGSERARALAGAYRELTGRDIENPPRSFFLD